VQGSIESQGTRLGIVDPTQTEQRIGKVRLFRDSCGSVAGNWRPRPKTLYYLWTLSGKVLFP
jgi:hypothetical protein